MPASWGTCCLYVSPMVKAEHSPEMLVPLRQTIPHIPKHNNFIIFITMTENFTHIAHIWQAVTSLSWSLEHYPSHLFYHLQNIKLQWKITRNFQLHRLSWIIHFNILCLWGFWSINREQYVQECYTSLYILLLFCHIPLHIVKLQFMSHLPHLQSSVQPFGWSWCSLLTILMARRQNSQLNPLTYYARRRRCHTVFNTILCSDTLLQILPISAVVFHWGSALIEAAL